jgi:citrate lyase beta subunit
VVSRAAGLEPPIDSVSPRLDDEAGLREQALGWAREVVAAFERAGGHALLRGAP